MKNYNELDILIWRIYNRFNNHLSEFNFPFGSLTDIMIESLRKSYDDWGLSPHSHRYPGFTNLFQFGHTNEEIKQRCFIVWEKWLEKHTPIKQQRKGTTKDNDGKRVGSGGSGYRGNKIRVPSKKHKNRYKNFLKLFPHYE